ncbi:MULTISPECIES: FitA-like ribbon-helix-helix domain-containing protein [Brevibacterium]|uniref:FitA-like ribbon-helix-helix domain-containing protein n=1 Tax=Brevibacterium TaxID=1696 RepID=UPI001BA4C3F1|nr:hypothetical protein [Brevibacterium sp. W7.2]
MTAIQIRDVPPEIRDQLAARAREKGQSLSSYLRDVIIREARFADNARVIDEISTWKGQRSFSVDDVLDVIDTGRSA